MATAKKRKSTQEDTRKKEELFLSVLSECGNVQAAAKKAKLVRRSLYRKRDKNKAFAAAWDEAAALGAEALEDEARRRSYEGWEEPVWHHGRQCGTIRKFSDTLLIVLLKAHKPEKYKENVKKTVEGELAITWQS